MPSTEPREEVVTLQSVILQGGPFDGERRPVKRVQLGVTRVPGKEDTPFMGLPNWLEVEGESDERVHIYEKRAGGAYYLHRGPKPRAEGETA